MRQISTCFLVVAVLLAVARPALSQVKAPPAPPEAVVGKTTIKANAGQTTINGTVVTSVGEPISNTTVQARDLLSGKIEASTKTTTTGQFALSVTPGNYVLEVVDDAGQVIGTSSFISAAAGASVAATVTVAGTALSAVDTAAGLAAALGATSARGVAFAAAAAGVAGVVTPQGTPTASASR